MSLLATLIKQAQAAKPDLVGGQRLNFEIGKNNRQTIKLYLAQYGSCKVWEIVLGTGLSTSCVQSHLRELLKAKEVTRSTEGWPSVWQLSEDPK